MEDLANNTLVVLKKSSASAEAKISAVNSLKSSIKHQRVPEAAQATTLECLRLAITTTVSASLVTTAFSGLSHLVKRLTLQEQTAVLFAQKTNLLGILAEKIGDVREAHRTAAAQALSDLWPTKPAEIEQVVRESAIDSTNARAKVAGIQWVLKMHEEHQLQFRSFVSPIVECLEDADGTVRDTAKNTLVDLFRTARDAAKADLKRQLNAHGVRKSIADHILSQLQLASSHGPSSSSIAHVPQTETPYPEPKVPDASHEPSLPPSVEVERIEPLYFHSQRELEDAFRQMQPCFEDKESEANWKARDKSVLTLRRMLKGNVPEDHHAILVTSLKAVLDGILKVVNSLRTTMSTNGCLLVQDMAKTLTFALEPMAEIILRGIEKMCAATKHIAAQNANNTVDTLLAHVPYSIRYMQHILGASGDKNVLPRQFAAGWLKTVLTKQMPSRGYFDHSGGLEVADKCIRKGLADANPKVRELMRGTYWTFAAMFADKAESIISSLDAKSRQLLEHDSNNPDASKAAFTASVGPAAATNPRAPQNARSTLKETIAAQRNAARKLPDRPNSAMSSFTPVRQAPASASRGATNSTATGQQRVPSGAPSHASSRSAVSTTSTASAGHGSLMSAPMRRPKRPDVPRPFTADPYAGRNAMRDDSPPVSPILSPHASTKSSASSKTPAHVKSNSTTSVLGNTGSTTSSRAGSPKVSPTKKPAPSTGRPPSRAAATSQRNVRADKGMLSPPAREDNFTMVIPDGRTMQRNPFASTRMRNNEADRPGSNHSSQLGAIDEDNFTMVMPDTSTFKQQPIPASSQAQGGGQDIGKEDAVMVYEDPVVEDIMASQSDDVPTVLEELPLNEQNTAAVQAAQQPASHTSSNTSSPSQSSRPADQNRTQQRTGSPIKRNLPTSPTKQSPVLNGAMPNSPMPDRAETLKTRRLLASGTERVRASTLDAHGFRRLQDLIKNNTRNPDLQFAPLLMALVGYLKVPTLDGAEPKEKALKGQALSCLRAVIALYAQRDDQVKAALPDVLVGISEAAATATGSGAIELEKAGNEAVVRLSSLSDASLVVSCIDTITEFVGQNGSLSPVQSRTSLADVTKPALQTQQHSSRSTALALSILSRLTALYMQLAGTEQRPDVYETIRTRLATFAVTCLRHTDPDVRRKGIDFAVELYGLFPSDTASADAGNADHAEASGRSSGKEEFWTLLRPAGEQSCNLLTYYLARRGRVGAVA